MRRVVAVLMWASLAMALDAAPAVAYAEQGTASGLGLVLVVVGLFVVVLPLILFAVLLSNIAAVRKAVERQTDVLEAIGRNAGWLPPSPPRR